MLLGNPVAFSIGEFSVYWYGIIITGAILGGTIFAMFEARRRKLSSDYVLTLFLWVVPLAVIFARLFYVIFHINDFLPINSFSDVVAMISTREGGITIVGAVPGGALGVYFASKRSKVSYIETLDMAAPCMILGQALGRWGNFVNQELYGQQVLNEAFQKFPFAVQIDRHVVYNAAGEHVEIIHNGWFQATFFYEMVLNYIGFAVLLVLSRKYKKNGIIFVGYLAWYAAVRAVMESIRTDAISIGGVKIGVVGGAGVALVAILIILLLWTGKIKTATPSHLLDAQCAAVGTQCAVGDGTNGNSCNISDNDAPNNNTDTEDLSGINNASNSQADINDMSDTASASNDNANTDSLSNTAPASNSQADINDMSDTAPASNDNANTDSLPNTDNILSPQKDTNGLSDTINTASSVRKGTNGVLDTVKSVKKQQSKGGAKGKNKENNDEKR